MADAGAGWWHLLEPPRLVEHFVAHPPEGFTARRSAAGTPLFSARFDLLTTLDDDTRRLLQRLPLFPWWSRAWRWRTCFVGTVVTEYAVFARGAPPEAFVQELLHGPLGAHVAAHPMLIVKDLPQDSPLLPAADNAHAAALAQALAAAGFTLLEGQALAWLPIDFASIDDYLSRQSAARRKDIRRKLRRQGDLQLEERATGDACFADPALRERLYRLYRNCYEQSEIHFDLLTPAFFDAVLQDPASDGRLFLYRHAGRIIGFNLCFIVGGTLIDKYVGFEYPAAREHNLYFVNWVRNLEYALAHGLQRFVAGWTDPQIKAYLGARFSFTRHAVYPRNALVRAALRRLAGRFEGDRAWFDAQARSGGAG